MKVFLLKISYIVFQPIFQHIDLNAQVVGFTYYFWKILKDITSLLGRAKKAYIFKFKHIEIAIGENISF